MKKHQQANKRAIQTSSQSPSQPVPFPSPLSNKGANLNPNSNPSSGPIQSPNLSPSTQTSPPSASGLKEMELPNVPPRIAWENIATAIRANAKLGLEEWPVMLGSLRAIEVLVEKSETEK